MSKAPAFAITQALSVAGYFPRWYSYYAAQLGPESLYVVTDAETREQFRPFRLGGVLGYPNTRYDESARVAFMASVVSGLLELFEVAVVCDTDEFLIPDPRKYPSLLGFLHERRELYHTAIGLDVVQVAEDGPLDLVSPILTDQRKYAYLTSSLCKTLLTRIPITWGVGYHYASVAPRFGDLYLFHLKRADRQMQLTWLERMSRLEIPTEQIRDYYRPDGVKLDAFYSAINGWPRVRGWEALLDQGFQSDFNAALALDRSGIYRGRHFQQHRLIELPTEFRGSL